MTPEEIIDSAIAKLRKEGLILQRDYEVADIIKMTDCSKTWIANKKLHGQYYIGKKRLFRREEIEYRRKLGLNLAVEI
jgi:hypothetical protein